MRLVNEKFLKLLLDIQRKSEKRKKRKKFPMNGVSEEPCNSFDLHVKEKEVDVLHVWEDE